MRFFHSEQEDEEMQICPICCEETERYYIYPSKEVIGCENCITKVNAYRHNKLLHIEDELNEADRIYEDERSYQ